MQYILFRIPLPQSNILHTSSPTQIHTLPKGKRNNEDFAKKSKGRINRNLLHFDKGDKTLTMKLLPILEYHRILNTCTWLGLLRSLTYKRPRSSLWKRGLVRGRTVDDFQSETTGNSRKREHWVEMKRWDTRQWRRQGTREELGWHITQDRDIESMVFEFN